MLQYYTTLHYITRHYILYTGLHIYGSVHSVTGACPGRTGIRPSRTATCQPVDGPVPRDCQFFRHTRTEQLLSEKGRRNAGKHLDRCFCNRYRKILVLRDVNFSKNFLPPKPCCLRGWTGPSWQDDPSRKNPGMASRGRLSKRAKAHTQALGMCLCVPCVCALMCVCVP